MSTPNDANIAPRFKRPGSHGALGIASNPENWYILKEQPPGGAAPVAIRGTEQFAIYRRGEP